MLTSFPDCPRRAFARAFPELLKAAGYDIRQTPISAGAAVGTGVHAAAAYTLQSKVDTGELGHEDEALDRAIGAFRKEIGFGETAWDDTTRAPQFGEEQIRRMTLVLRRHLAPKLNPVQVEKRLEAELDGGFILSGQADNVELRPDGIRDLKTGSQQRVHHAQVGAYSILRRSYGHPVDRLSDDFIKRVPLKVEQPLPVTTEYDPALAEAVAYQRIRLVQRAVNDFRTAQDTIVLTANPMSALCSDRYCPLWGTPACREHKGANVKPTQTGAQNG